jgi:hypothetical protein
MQIHFLLHHGRTMNQGLAQQTKKGPAGPLFAPTNPYFGLLPKEFVGRVKDPFVYNIIFNPITATTTGTATANVQNDSDFVWTQGTVTVTATDNTTFTSALTIPGLIELFDSASGRGLQDAATPVSAWFGSAQLPFFLQSPKIFRAGGQITARLQNQGSTSLVYRFAFHGFKVFPMQQPNG